MYKYAKNEWFVSAESEKTKTTDTDIFSKCGALVTKQESQKLAE